MEMNFGHWMALESAMQADQPRRWISRVTLRRVASFASPHKRSLIWFVLLSIVGAVLTVATPVLAGQVVEEIVDDGSARTIVTIAIVIALIAVAEGLVSIASRWQSARI